jgi:hypothetical protein
VSRLGEAYDRYITAKAAYEKARDELFRLSSEPESSAPRFKTLDELDATLDKQRREQAQKAAKEQVDPAQRIKEIEDELDVIRGVKPTPRGCVVDRSKVRQLVKEREQLLSSR